MTPPAKPPAAQDVRLGRTRPNGLAPALYGLIERGVQREPGVAAQLRGKIVFRFAEDFLPVRMHFKKRVVVVEDGDFRKPNLAISGRMPDIVQLTSVDTWRGLPDPRRAGGRSALAMVARRRVRIEGDVRLARQLIRLLAV